MLQILFLSGFRFCSNFSFLKFDWYMYALLMQFVISCLLTEMKARLKMFFDFCCLMYTSNHSNWIHVYHIPFSFPSCIFVIVNLNSAATNSSKTYDMDEIKSLARKSTSSENLLPGDDYLAVAIPRWPVFTCNMSFTNSIHRSTQHVWKWICGYRLSWGKICVKSMIVFGWLYKNFVAPI